MKRQVFFLSIILIGISNIAAAPKRCSGDDEYIKGLNLLKDFTLVKDYRISLSGGKSGEPSPFISYPISLTNGMKYKLYGINNPDNETKLIVSIYSNAKSEILLASTYSTSVKKHYESVEFVSKTTGTFYITFQFEGGKAGCGVGFFCVQK